MMMDSPDALSATIRAVSFVLLLNAAGLPIFIAAFGRLMPDSLPAVKRLGWQFAIGALVIVIAHQALEAARMAGEMSGIADPAMQKMALLSPPGAAFAARSLGLILVAIGMWRAARSAAGADSGRSAGVVRSNAAQPASHGAPLLGPSTIVALLGTLTIATSFALTGHTTTTHHRVAAASLITLHLLVAAFWLGSLWPLYIAAGKERPNVAGRVIEAFSRAAAWVVPLLFLAGVGLSALLLPNLQAFKLPYGQLLLAKVTGFSVLIALASLNKWSFGPACAEGNTAAFRRTVVIEYVLICAVLTATACMTMFYSPELE